MPDNEEPVEVEDSALTGKKSVENTYNQLLVDASKIMLDPPATWNVYPKNKEGAMKILEMEFKEMIVAKSRKELLHVMAAAFNAWKYCEDK